MCYYNIHANLLLYIYTCFSLLGSLYKKEKLTVQVTSKGLVLLLQQSSSQ